ncbi:MAG: ferrous iron transport protein A [Erysipelothrix sp.]|nr:ferrous iron transport protein A [Erysipelothrix sp.]
MKLSEARLEEKVIITKVGGDGSFHHRLLDMGLTKGQVIYIKNIAPFGDPIDIHVRGYELSIRLAEAKFIEVERISE